MRLNSGGRYYDTETAKLCATHKEDPYHQSQSWTEETLYQKRTGEFFLHCVGGPSSLYGKRGEDGVWVAGSKITPLSYDAALEWAKRNIDMELTDKIFWADDTSGAYDKKVAISITLRSSALKIARRDAAKAGMNLSAYIEKRILEGRDIEPTGHH